jgi:Skp family chaperone for outer membrane proteins
MKRTIATFVVGALATVSLMSLSNANQAAPDAAAKVALASPSKIFKDMAETQDLQAKLKEEAGQLRTTEQQKKTKLEDMVAALKALKPDAPQFAEKKREFIQAQAEFQAWGQIAQSEVQARQKSQIKGLFDKIQIATAQLAQQKGYDVVLTDARQEIPENLEALTVEQLQGLIQSRNVLFASPRIDISDQVTALLDTQYKAGK